MIGIELEDIQWSHIGNCPKYIRVILLIVIVIITFSFGYILFIKDYIHNYKAVKQHKSELQTFFEKNSTLLLDLEAYKQEFLVLEESLQALYNQLPTNSDFGELLEDITRQVTSSGLIFLSFKPLPEIKKHPFTEHTIELILQGDYHAFGQFSDYICKMNRLTTLHDFILKSVTSNPKNLDIKIKIKTYSLKETKQNSTPPIQDQNLLKQWFDSLKDNLTENPPLQNEYKSQHLRNPFEAFVSSAAVKLPPFLMDSESNLHRPKEYLENFSLDSLQMVGTIENETEISALIRDRQGILHRVNVGNFIGQNSGKIKTITESTIEIVEWGLSPNQKDYEEHAVLIHLAS